MWTWSRGTGKATAVGLWSRWSSGSARAASGPSSNRIAADDNPMLLMSIAMRPLCTPPFPLERIEEMTALMGGEGRIR